MNPGFALALALFQESPAFWSGVVLWLLGFALYLPAAFGRGPAALEKTAMALCLLGLAITLMAAWALDTHYRAPTLEPPAFSWPYWFRSSTQIWLLWIVGGSLAIASTLRWFSTRVGWLGIAAAMVGAVASWFSDSASQQAVIEVGTAFVAVLLAVIAWRDDLHPRAAGDVRERSG